MLHMLPLISSPLPARAVPGKKQSIIERLFREAKIPPSPSRPRPMARGEGGGNKKKKNPQVKKKEK